MRDFDDAARSDTERYAALFRHLLDRGIYVAPSQFECHVRLARARRRRDRQDDRGRWRLLRQLRPTSGRRSRPRRRRRARSGRESLRPAGEREPVPIFSELCDRRFALGVETIYEGYLLHYGRPRLFAPADPDTALLLGDYLYAHGLVRIAATGSVEAVHDLAELISLCAQARAEGGPARPRRGPRRRRCSARGALDAAAPGAERARRRRPAR